VNGEDLRDATHERAIQVLRETPSTVCMLVFRDESVLQDEDIYDVFAVDLMKKPGRGLGISIVGRRNDTGIFISDIVSVADLVPHNVVKRHTCCNYFVNCLYLINRIRIICSHIIYFHTCCLCTIFTY